MTERVYVGQLRQFTLNVSDWVIYKAHLFNYFTANEINSSERKRAIFLHMLDEEAYKLMFTLGHPVLPEDIPFNTLVSLFDEQFTPRMSVFAERCKFYNAKKLKHESAEDWAIRIKSLAATCKFGSELEVFLRDKFICGFEEEKHVFCLLKDNVDVSFEEAVRVAEENQVHSEKHCYYSVYYPRSFCDNPYNFQNYMKSLHLRDLYWHFPYGFSVWDGHSC